MTDRAETSDEYIPTILFSNGISRDFFRNSPSFDQQAQKHDTHLDYETRLAETDRA
jgi:hypothetical protein